MGFSNASLESRRNLKTIQSIQDIGNCSAVTYMAADLTPADVPVVLDYKGCWCGHAVAEKVEDSIVAGSHAIWIRQNRESSFRQFNHPQGTVRVVSTDGYQLDVASFKFWIPALQLDQLLLAKASEEPSVENDHHSLAIFQEVVERDTISRSGH